MVSICTGGHPLDAGTRISGFGFGKPATFGDNAVIAAGAVRLNARAL